MTVVLESVMCLLGSKKKKEMKKVKERRRVL